KEFLNKQEKELSDQLEKKNAIIENRSAARIYKVEKDDTILNGRLMSNDGKKPIAGAKVLIRIKGDGTSKPALAQAVTDMNGEYSIPLNKNKLKSAGENISVNFETRKGVKLANSKNIAINSVRGKAKTIDGKISADKVESAEGLIADTETNKHHAYLEMAELKKSEAQMTHFQYKTETTKNELKEKISKLRNLFESE
ncbi:MAG: hypothetical protein GY707_02205, partial [Desulfobacteraceae bacterium]|nr:hypothetical protein [Desulfobacteraceae bacterium]